MVSESASGGDGDLASAWDYLSGAMTILWVNGSAGGSSWVPALAGGLGFGSAFYCDLECWLEDVMVYEMVSELVFALDVLVPLWGCESAALLEYELANVLVWCSAHA